MSEKERKRLAIMARVKETEMTIREESEVLGISYRQTRPCLAADRAYIGDTWRKGTED